MREVTGAEVAAMWAVDGDGWTDVLGRRGGEDSLRVRLWWRDKVDAAYWDEEQQGWVGLPLHLAPRVPASTNNDDALGWLIERLAIPCDIERAVRVSSRLPARHRHLVPKANAILATFCSRLDGELLRVVRRFAPWTRVLLYARLREDATGRLRQLMAACPGAMLLFAGILDPGNPVENGIACALLDGVLAGRPLNKLIDETLHGLLAHRASGHAQGVDASLLEAYRWLDGSPPKVRERQMLRWRLLVRRAGRHVHPSLLVRPPPLGFEPDDIPTRVHENASWYRRMNGHDGFIVPALAFGEETCRRAGHALSRIDGRHAWMLAHDAFFDWVHAHPEVDVRKTSVEELTRRALHHVCAALEDPELLGRPFPPPPVEPVETPELRVVPLTSAGTLLDEGDQMHHCVGSYTSKVQEGLSYVYAAQVGSERLTVELQPSTSGGWCIAQIRGLANTAASPASVALLSAWCPHGGNSSP